MSLSLKRTIIVVITIFILIGLFVALERIIWVNTDYCLIKQNNINIKEENKKIITDYKCNDVWEIIRTDNATKYRCGMWFPNTVNIIKYNTKEE